VKVVAALDPSLVVGVGRFAAERARASLGDRVGLGCIPHPSPANPGANRDWPRAVDTRLGELGFDPRDPPAHG
jgi:single-strand selective monofunctional uracil DNA glycosylase